VNYIVQEDGGSVWGFVHEPEKDEDDEWMEILRTGTHKLLAQLPEASDRATAIVTREQYEAALAAKNGGWIEWGGGECPVPCGTLVDVRYRDSDNYPDALGIPALSGDGVSKDYWVQDGFCNDIIAYRLHKSHEAVQPKADLNECVSKDAALVWSGEGLPPVGCECESKQFAQIDWHKFRVVAIENGCVFGFWNGKVGVCLDSKHWEFRPLRTEAERAIDEMVRLSGVSIGAAKILYDAGYRK
ncbi:hypothetical protein, partial [Klebsiella pneumoniae]|uniref:hypothetical protein n=1 Tax=Klebsiella pneumoniae TaxID=573 RepID=UPI00102973DA